MKISTIATFATPLCLLLGITHGQTTADQARKVLDQAHKKAGTVAAIAPTAPAGQNFSNVPVPPPKVISKTPPPKSDGNMTIDANSLNYSQDNSRAVFRGKVRLRSATMDIDCEELEVLFKQGALQNSGDTVPAPTPKPAAPPAGFDPSKPNTPEGAAAPGVEKEVESQQIEKAWARGNGSTVTIVKRGAKNSVCKCGEATYDDKTGNLVMKIFPEAEQAGTRIQATERSTVLTLDRNGKLDAQGPTRVIQGAADAKPAPAAATEAPATKPATASTPPAPAAPAASTAPKIR